MINRLTGHLLEKNPPQVIIDVHGVGYEVDVPMSTFYNLPANGETLTLLTHFAVREDGHFLYGFTSEAERSTFRQLLKINGVGARLALAVLSGMSVDDLAQVVVRQDVGRLTKVPGIGPKTAERLLLELKGKLIEARPSSLTAADDVRGDILNALMALGYNDREAGAALKQLPAEITTADGIRMALKLLSKI
ncbi:MAG TPA: Holliday junction branch migration protein RuvA [Accumulibacter sp.]|nr:Holliday junction branch migration protein RuvA [Accumulibacter sp.]HMW17861.1 Holliday junction branch migration protein RuvA [Accumulibacter sp.]HMY07901.1 Holliday junction branch migration protein RuvA [Accumulibacter sp.]HNC17952.1 Holliday junction branch migration protein RuvA [Accumulibacter sp.]HND80350.1 Holliday junction branch migration protein RuvA [Accumulibacter sp.]